LEFLRDTWILFLRLVRATMRMPVFIILSIAQPILWVAMFGALFRSVVQIPGFGATSYVQFLAPGVAIMTALFGAAHSGMGMLVDIERGVLDRLLATPAARGSIIAARLLNSGVQVFIQAGLIVGVAMLLGAKAQGGVGGILLVMLAASLLGAAVAAFSNAVALLARRQETVIAVMNFVILPATFTSSMLMSANLMPAWVQRAANVNPVNWAIVAARDGFEGTAPHELATRLALLAAFALVCGLFATGSFGRYRRAM